MIDVCICVIIESHMAVVKIINIEIAKGKCLFM